jgi:hypothetical protein
MLSRRKSCSTSAPVPFEERDPHLLEAISHPGARIAHTQIVVVACFDLTDAVGQPFQNAIVVQDDLSVESPPQIDLHHIASQQSGLFQ